MNRTEYHIILCPHAVAAKSSWLQFSRSLQRFNRINRQYFTIVDSVYRPIQARNAIIKACVKPVTPGDHIYDGLQYVVDTMDDELYMFIDEEALTRVPVIPADGFNVKVHYMDKFIKYIKEFEKETK